MIEVKCSGGNEPKIKVIRMCRGGLSKDVGSC